MNALFRSQTFLVILLLATLVRLYRVSYPLLDWHSWRQVDTVSVTQEYVNRGIDLLHPRYHDLSNIPSGKDNSEEGYRMVEFPFLNAGIAWIFTHQDIFDLVTLSRLVSIVMSIISLIALATLTKSIWGQKIAELTALTFALFPFNVYYSRVALPEPAAVLFATVSITAFHFWLSKKQFRWYLLSLVSLSLGLLIKPFVAFFGPVYLALLLYHRDWFFWNKQTWLERGSTLVFAPIAFLPFWWWRTWIAQFPEGIPASNWLFNGDGIRLRPAWFRWLGYERFTKLIWGYIGVVFAYLSLPNLSKKAQNQSALIFYAWWISIIAYLIVIAKGNVQHDYYQAIAMPIVALTTALGMVRLQTWTAANFALKFPKNKTRAERIGWSISLSVFVLMLLSSWKLVGGYFNVNHWEYVIAGAAVDHKVPADALVIAPAMGDTAFLFQTGRRGWPIGFEIDKKIELGATHYVTTAYDDEARELEKKYKVVTKNPSYIIIDLTQPSQL